MTGHVVLHPTPSVFPVNILPITAILPQSLYPLLLLLWYYYSFLFLNLWDSDGNVGTFPLPPLCKILFGCTPPSLDKLETSRRLNKTWFWVCISWLHVSNKLNATLMGWSLQCVSGGVYTQVYKRDWYWLDGCWAADRCVFRHDAVSLSGHFRVSQSWYSLTRWLHAHYWLVCCLHHAAVSQSQTGNSL